jgi:hypothetical protein
MPSVRIWGVTIDQLIAQKYGQDTILSSIQLGIEDTGNFGIATGDTAAPIPNSISVDDTRLSRYPLSAILEWLSSACSAMEPVTRRAFVTGRKQNASILDSVTRELGLLQEGSRRR